MWTPYLYVYGIGGLVFVAGLVIALRSGALTVRRPLVALLVAGFAAYALGHAALQLAAGDGALPPRGAARGAEGVIGSGTDLAVVAVYFATIIGLGAWFARFTRTTSDFFFAGRRFSGWLIAISCVATTVGSYSFVKYSAAGFSFGLASSMSYLNDWFWMPLWMAVWLPIIYYRRIQSVPEYFERRFGRQARVVSTLILLVYLVGYIGINFLTMGKALHALTGWPIFGAACVAAVATGLYVVFGGQTSVIMTDLVQGVLLLAVGLGLFAAGLTYLGGIDVFWDALPPPHRAGFAHLTEPSSFSTMGVFWQDAMAGGVAFYFMNQGILMRFMAARSVHEGRKAAALVVLVVMPVAAVAVSGTGWIGRGMATTGAIAADTSPDNVFVIVSALLATPGVFGLIMAALTAALMSTADTLLTAVAAIFVNDIWRPFLGGVDERRALATARGTTIATAGLAVLLVLVFKEFDSIYVAHATFVAAVVPPMAVALVLGAVWPRYGHGAALLTLVGGTLAILASIVWPDLIAPLAQGTEPGGEGLKAYKYMRALYGLVASGALAVIGVRLFPSTAPADPLLVAGPETALRRAFKAGEPKATGGAHRLVLAATDIAVRTAEGADEVLVRLHPDDQARLDLAPGDLVHIARPGRWHGGLLSTHARVEDVGGERPGSVELPSAMVRTSGLVDGGAVVVRREA